MKIHNTKVYGKPLYEGIVGKIEEITNKNEWDGLKGLYIQYPLDSIDHAGCLISEEGKTELELDLYDKNKALIFSEMLVNEDFPIVVVNGWIDNEYEFLAVILHELKHYLDQKDGVIFESEIEKEYGANEFARDRLNRLNIIPGEIKLKYWTP